MSRIILTIVVFSLYQFALFSQGTSCNLDDGSPAGTAAEVSSGTGNTVVSVGDFYYDRSKDMNTYSDSEVESDDESSGSTKSAKIVTYGWIQDTRTPYQKIRDSYLDYDTKAKIHYMENQMNVSMQMAEQIGNNVSDMLMSIYNGMEAADIRKQQTRSERIKDYEINMLKNAIDRENSLTEFEKRNYLGIYHDAEELIFDKEKQTYQVIDFSAADVYREVYGGTYTFQRRDKAKEGRAYVIGHQYFKNSNIFYGTNQYGNLVSSNGSSTWISGSNFTKREIMSFPYGSTLFSEKKRKCIYYRENFINVIDLIDCTVSKRIYPPKAGNGAITNIIFSRNNYIALEIKGKHTTSLIFYDLNSLKKLSTVKITPGSDVYFTDDEITAFFISDKGELVSYDFLRGKQLKTYIVKDPIVSFKISPTADVCYIDNGKEINIYDLELEQKIFKINARNIKQGVISNTGNLIILANNRNLIICNAVTGKLVRAKMSFDNLSEMRVENSGKDIVLSNINGPTKSYILVLDLMKIINKS